MNENKTNRQQKNNTPVATTKQLVDEKKSWQCRWVTGKDQAALLSLFSSAFGQVMPASMWTWKYAGLSHQGVLAHVNGKVIAYYGGIPRSLWLHGQELPAVQICDVMVAPEMRGILTRRGAFACTAETFLKAQTGINKPYRLAFGFPSQRAARLGETLRLYARGDTLLEAVWTTHSPVRLPFWLKVQPLQSCNEAIFGKLWQDMKLSLDDTLLPQKDASFFRWRYLEHPEHIYQVYIVSWRYFNMPFGILVLRDHGPNHGMELMDLLGPPKALGELLKAAQTIAAEMSRQRLFSWITPFILSMLPSPSAQSEITGVYIDPPALTEMANHIQEHCWFMGGDTDFR
jgi:hypothetical protein